MAIIIPFADADAHGSICDTVSFRRSRGKVVFQKKPKPKQPNTPAQQAQKQWWKDTWNAWHQLTAAQIAWLEAQAGPAKTTPANYYFDKTDSPDAYTRVPINVIEIVTAFNIDDPASPIGQGLYVQLGCFEYPPLTLRWVIGWIYDNENTYTQTDLPSPYQVFGFAFTNVSGAPIQIPEDYSFTFTYTKFGGGGKTVTVKLPAHLFGIGASWRIYADTSWALYDAYPLQDPIKVNPQNWPPDN